MQIKLDFRSGQPIYIQIVDQIRQMVVSGDLKPGDQLPTVRQLATELRVNFNTVARAYRALDEAGLISTQQGRGTYIWEMPDAETSRRLRLQGLEVLTRRYLADAARMEFSPGDIAEAIVRNIRLWQESGVPPQPEDRELTHSPLEIFEEA
jgi:GntR family transcriptional regulator